MLSPWLELPGTAELLGRWSERTGVDLVVHSATKAIAGHNDATLGVVAGEAELIDAVWGYGILHGAEAIPEEWLTPVGRKIKTACLNLGELDYIGTPLPATVDELTDRTERIAQQVILRRRLPITIAENAPTDLSDLDVQTLYAPKPGTRQGRWHLMRNLGQPLEFALPAANIAAMEGAEWPI